MPEPISLGRDTSIPALFRRYYTDPRFTTLPPDVTGPLFQLDYNRAIRGANPTPVKAIPGAIAALQTGQAQAVAKPKDLTLNPLEWLGRVGKDVGTIATSLPRLPKTIVKEITGQDRGEVEGTGLGSFFDKPGIRLVPGAYTASGLLPGGLPAGELAQHPLFTALDVAPYTKWGFQRAAATARGQAALSRVADTADKFGVGPVSQAAARLTAQGQRELRVGMSEFGNRVNAIGVEHDVDIVRRMELTKLATEDPQSLSTLPAHEQRYLKAIRTETEMMERRLEDTGIAGRYEGELYPIKDYEWFTKQQDRILDARDTGNLKRANELQTQMDQRYARRPPIRFRPVLLEHYKNELLDMAHANNPNLNADAWDTIGKDIAEGYWDKVVPVVSWKEMRDLRNSITPTWVGMKAAGLDPILLPNVNLSQAEHLVRPTLYPAADYKPKLIVSGTWNVKPGIKDFAVGLGLSEYEFLRQQVTKELISEIAANPLWSRTKSEVRDEALTRLRGRKNPPVPGTEALVLEKELTGNWVEWHPESIFPFRSPRQHVDLAEAATDTRYMRKAMADTLTKIFDSQKSEFLRTWDSATKVFRTSILPMSPRWHVYNILGGAVMMQARTGPGIWKYMRDAVRMVKHGEMPNGLSRGFFDIPEDSRLWEHHTGRALYRWNNEAKPVSAARQAGRTVEQQTVGRAFSAAESVDSMYRAAAYLYGKDKALTKGMTQGQAIEAGMKLSNKVLQDWDAMVPFERQVLRTIFPFYGWMKHILGYAMTYPWDHPWRASVISNFARAEMADWQTGLPEQFRNYLFLPSWLGGGKDEYGNEKAVNARGANPFADLESYSTLAGYASQLHPILGGVLQAMGINPVTNKAELYPELAYNPETGRLEPKGDSPISTVVNQLIPPLPVIRELTGLVPSEDRQMQLSDPQAYKGMVWSAAGVPFVPKGVNKPLEIARSEVIRQQGMQDVLNHALKSGDWSEAERYPQLRPILDAYRQQMAMGALDQLQLQPKPTGIVGREQLLGGL